MATRSGIAKRREAPLRTPSYLGAENVRNLTAELNVFLADVFAIYIKTKNFHWHVSGPHFRDYHLLLDEQAEQVFAMTDDIGERVRGWAEPRFARSGTWLVLNTSPTTMRNTWNRWT